MFIPGWKAEKPDVIAAKLQPGLKREFEQEHIDGIFNETKW